MGRGCVATTFLPALSTPSWPRYLGWIIADGFDGKWLHVTLVLGANTIDLYDMSL